MLAGEIKAMRTALGLPEVVECKSTFGPVRPVAGVPMLLGTVGGEGRPAMDAWGFSCKVQPDSAAGAGSVVVTLARKSGETIYRVPCGSPGFFLIIPAAYDSVPIPADDDSQAIEVWAESDGHSLVAVGVICQVRA